MKMLGNTRVKSLLAILFLVMSPIIALGQTTLNITDDVITYSSLTDTTVNMSGRSELHITAAATPLTSCEVNLDSLNSWLFLEQIKPSVAVSTYLSQVNVSGAAAALNTNVRVVQYADGAVVIPQASTYQPLQVFTEENFMGDSASLSQYTEYDSDALGAMASEISSFILKRGYTATFAQNENGSGYSMNYVAQDCDLEIGVLPSKLDNKINFVRVFPWRWISKKGSCDASPTDLEAYWWYNWNINQNSTLDLEYVAIHQQPYWPGLSQDWQARGVNHLSGFNEPDNPVEDAYKNLNNGSVDSAIYHWPPHLATGLRVGAPAVTDGGRDWLYQFIDAADAAGLRVDYVPIHYYWCYSNNDYPAGAATQLYNFLKAVHDEVQRPIWLTEFNNGANWTGCTDPSYAQNSAVIEAMIDMLDSTPWVERYAIYSRVEYMRQTHYDEGGLTPMGVMYRDHVAPIGYQQAVPGSGKSPNAIYHFDADFRDSSGNGNHPLQYGAPKLPAGQQGNALNLDGVDDYLVLPTNMGEGDDFTFAAWVYWNGGDMNQRIFDFGNGTSEYMFLTPRSGTENLRFGFRTSAVYENLYGSTALATGTWTHVAVTLDGDVGTLYVNGTAVDTQTVTNDPSDMLPQNNFLGDSQWSADPLFSGMLDEVVIADYAMSAAQITDLLDNQPPQFNTDPIDGGNAMQRVDYSGSIASYATDPDAGDTLTFSKLSGPDWLTVAADGSLSGTPYINDGGENVFVVCVSDGLSGSDQALLNITVEDTAQIAVHYKFDGDTNDCIGIFDGVPAGSPVYATGQLDQAIDLDGSNDLVTLPEGVAEFDDITIAAWVNWDGGGSWQRIFDFGNGTSEYMFLTPSSGTGILRFAMLTGSGEQQLNASSALSTSAWRHVAVTISGNTGRMYVNGSQVAYNLSMTINPSDINQAINYIGDSQWSSDPFFNGRIDDFRIYNYALSVAEIADVMSGGHAPYFASNSIHKPNATPGEVYSSSLDIPDDADDADNYINPNDNALDTTGGDAAAALAASAVVSNFTGSSGAFTFEAIVCPQVNIGAIPNEMQIISGDSPSDRSWHFRVTTAGALEFNNIDGALCSATIPTTGNHAWAAGEWFHVAATYTGTPSVAGNMKLYWTRLDSGVASAVQLGSFTQTADLTSTDNIVFGVGNEGRSPSENFEGLIDEVRISDTARATLDLSTPFSADSSTIHLYHLNGNGSDAVAASAIDLTFSGGAVATADSYFPSGAGETLTFSKISGPGWLGVAADGTLAGAPSSEDAGLNSFTVRVTDAGGLYDEAILNITVFNGVIPDTSAAIWMLY
ncbi:hypothetical protein JXA32_12140 [Candidatus Sumerlaeota bacterium]|nr:hypothetical protein [Candidatus Sumerlaeota bacterium]